MQRRCLYSVPAGACLPCFAGGFAGVGWACLEHGCLNQTGHRLYTVALRYVFYAAIAAAASLASLLSCKLPIGGVDNRISHFHPQRHYEF